MAVATVANISTQSLRLKTCVTAMADLPLHPLPKSCRLDFQKGIKKESLGHGMAIRRQGKNILTPSRWGFPIMSSNTDHSDLVVGPPSASETIKHFYSCINEKDVKSVEAYISEDCYIEDCSFFNPFNGKKEVMNFFNVLIRSMGQNLKFIVEHVCEGDDFTAGVNWHLEWKQTQIPFTRGCSFYKCSEEDDKLVIKKAMIVIESPFKPGGMVLVLLKNLTMIFDEFPQVAEWFLKSPLVILQYILKIYTILIAPFIKPIVASYSRLLELMTWLLACAIKISVLISNIFFRIFTNENLNETKRFLESSKTKKEKVDKALTFKSVFGSYKREIPYE